MSAVQFDENGRDAAGFACCDVCKYPYRGLKCDNPGCWSNLSDARKAEVMAQMERDRADEAERERIRRIRYGATKPRR